MDSHTLKVSIITICYNAYCEIEQTIESVSVQTYPNIEYIIVDGGSDDGTLDIVEKYKKCISLVISERDHGISNAFNKGVLKSSGDVILFLNAGDWLLNEYVIAKYIEDYNTFGDDIIFYKAHIEKNKYIPDSKYNDNEMLIWKKAMVPHQATFVKRDVFEYIGLFNPSLRIRMDYDFFNRAVLANISHKYIPKTIVGYKPGGISMREENKWIFLLEELKINRFYGNNIDLVLYLKFFRRYIEHTIKAYFSRGKLKNKEV